MKNILKVSGLVGVLLLVLTGCRSASIYNVEHNKISTKKTSSVAVYKAIVTAGTVLGWEMEKIKEGEIKATLKLRKHVAKAKIEYDTTKYKITYISSVNLNYNSEKQTIHKNYNGWIQNLEKAINVQMKMLDL